MERYDYLIVGAGLAGSVSAERLNSIGKKVLVIDRRNHVAGNSHDFIDAAGVLVHKYGPHYFRTNSEEVRKYLSQFTLWHMCEYRIMACVNSELYPFPINRNTINQFFGLNLKTEEETQRFLDSKRPKIDRPSNSEEQIISQVGVELYDAFFRNYTRKQWGLDPKKLDPSVTGRIPIRTNTDDRYLDEKFQAMPKEGYTRMVEKMLSGIEVRLNTDFKDIKDKIRFDRLIYTGRIDEFFNYRYGRLPYRSLNFRFKTLNMEYHQGWSQINYPNDYKSTRIVEIKHATGQKHPNTTIVKEAPTSEGEPFYPILTKENHALYEKYENEAKQLRNVYFIGRLAQYKYFNMDQVVLNALHLFEQLRKEK